MAAGQCAIQKLGPWKKPDLDPGLSASRFLRKFLLIHPVYGTFYGSPEDSEVAWGHQEVRDSEGTATITASPMGETPKGLAEKGKGGVLHPQIFGQVLARRGQKNKVCVCGGGVYAVAWASPQEPGCVLQDKTGSYSGGL